MRLRFAQEKQEIIERFLRLYDTGMINMFEGNISVRTGGVILMTPSQMEKDKITPEMIVEMDPDGRILNETGTKPSSEYKMHLEIYRLRQDLHAVVHTHSAHAAAYASCGEPIAGDMAEMYMFFGGSIPVCRYGAPGSVDIFADFPKYFLNEDLDAVLLANHGLVTAGNTLANAYSKTEAAEKLAEIGIYQRQLGKRAPLSEKEIAKLLAFYKNRKQA